MEEEKNIIWYDVQNGRLKYFYGPLQSEGCAEFCGFVPEEVVSKGDEAVKRYVAAEIKKKEIAKWKRLNKRLRKIESTNFPIEVIHGGVYLKGRIIDYSPKNDDRGGIEVLLEEPREYKGKDQIIECFGLRIPFFDDDGNLTEEMIEYAKRCLIEIYEERRKEILKQKSAPQAYEMVKRLNKEVG
jgi:hypothetical protein